MAILSDKLKRVVAERYEASRGITPFFASVSGETGARDDVLRVLSNAGRRRSYALQQWLDRGEPYLFEAAPGLMCWVIGLEHRRLVHGALVAGPVRLEADGEGAALDYLEAHGMRPEAARGLLEAVPTWSRADVEAAGAELQELFYKVSGWRPELMEENRLKLRQKAQFNRAMEDQRRGGGEALYAFEKERALLANIRAGDRNTARRLLNEMLSTIFLSSASVVVLRARAIELMSCLTRAAIEDNPMLEPLIERNHAWTEKLITAETFEALSEVLMTALDDFIDGVYLHGLNRSNTRVREALDYIAEHFAEPISLQDVAREVGLSPGRLAHLVKQYTGRTVVKIIHFTRIREAQRLLERTSKSCTEIAYEVGFSEQSYFTLQFRKLMGTTPARYRRARR